VGASLTLYVEAFWANCWDCTPYVALREKGLPFSTAIAMLDDHAGVNPAVRREAITGLAPALQHGGFWVGESSAIVEYVEDTFPAPDWPRIFPADTAGRARARQLMSWLRMEHNQLRDERSTRVIFYPHADLPPLGDDARRQAANLISVVERFGPSARGALLGEWCIADVDVAFALMRLIRTGHQVPAAVAAYAEAVWQRPSVRSYVEHSRPPHAPRPRPCWMDD
jgi:glutathione S-transferase